MKPEDLIRAVEIARQPYRPRVTVVSPETYADVMEQDRLCGVESHREMVRHRRVRSGCKTRRRCVGRAYRKANQ